MFTTPFPFNYLVCIPLLPVVWIHNCLKHDNTVGFEVSPKRKWLYK